MVPILFLQIKGRNPSITLSRLLGKCGLSNSRMGPQKLSFPLPFRLYNEKKSMILKIYDNSISIFLHGNHHSSIKIHI